DPVLTAKTEKSPAATAKRKSRWWIRWPVRCFYFTTFIGILGWFAPAIVANTELRNLVVKLLLPQFPGQIEIGETSLAWMSPISIKNLNATDDAGNPLLEIAHFSTSEPLWKLVKQQAQLGTMVFTGPRVHISMNEVGSNIETLLAKLLSGPPTGKPIP